MRIIEWWVAPLSKIKEIEIKVILIIWKKYSFIELVYSTFEFKYIIIQSIIKVSTKYSVNQW